MILFRTIVSIFIFASVAAAQTQAPTTALKEITVQSTPLDKTIQELAQPVTSLDSKEIQQNGQTTLGETLSNQPGITSSYYGQGSSRPIIRGQSGDRIRIMQNGVGVQDASNTSPDHAVGLEPIQSDRIEVVRGPATLLYGPNAMGGVVNVFDNRIPEELPEKPLSGALDFRGGTVDSLRSAGGKIDLPMGDHFALHLDGFSRKTDDFRIPGFARSENLRVQGLAEGFSKEPIHKRPDSATDAQGGSIGSSFIFEKGFIGAALNLFNTNYGLPSDESDVSIELHQRRSDLRARVDDPVSSIKKIEFKSGIVDYQHRELVGSEVGTVFKNKGMDSRIELTHQAFGPVEGLVGLQYQYSDFSAVGEEAFIKPTITNTYSGFVFEEISVSDSFSIQTGGRLDGTEIRNIAYVAPGLVGEGTTRGKSSAVISAAISGVFQFADIYSSALSLTHTERAPSGTELFANGPHAGTAAFEIGDPNLDIERSLGLDLNLRKKNGYLTGFISTFYNRFNNYVSVSPTGETKDGLPEYIFQGFDADFFGAEAQVTAHLFGRRVEPDQDTKAREISGTNNTSASCSDEKHHLDLIAQADFVRAYDRTGQGDLPRIPPWRTLVAVDYQREDFGARVEAQHVFAQDDVAEFETDTDGYTLVNLVLMQDLKIDKINSTLFVRGNNIFDEEARSHTSFLKDLTPLPGRNIIAGIRFVF